MHQGKLVETGSHKMLMDANGRYAALYMQQKLIVANSNSFSGHDRG